MSAKPACVLVVLPHVIVSPAALVRVRVGVTMLATLAEVVLCVGDAVAVTTAAVGVVLRVVGVAGILIVWIAVLVSLDVVAVLLRLPRTCVVLLLLRTWPVVLVRLILLLQTLLVIVINTEDFKAHLLVPLILGKLIGLLLGLL